MVKKLTFVFYLRDFPLHVDFRTRYVEQISCVKALPSPSIMDVPIQSNNVLYIFVRLHTVNIFFCFYAVIVFLIKKPSWF